MIPSRPITNPVAMLVCQLSHFSHLTILPTITTLFRHAAYSSVDGLTASDGSFNSTSEEVELYLKLSVPLANLIVIFIGAPLALTSHRQGMAFGFGLAVILGFGLWGALAVGRALGQNGTLPPMLAAFLPDMIFFAMGLVLLFRAKS